MAAELGLGSRGSGIDRLGALLSQLQDRVRRLEQRRTYSVGAWVLSEDASGNLIATNTNTAAVVTLGSP